MAIIGIIAIAENFAIGKGGKLPWHYSADLKFFKQTTLNNCIVMGYNTWESIGKPLPNRLNIILSRSKTIENQTNVSLLRSKEEIIALANYLKSDLFIIGGAKTYTDFADVIDKWIVTEIPLVVENADVFMPADFLDNFQLVEKKELDDILKVAIYTKTAKTSLE